MARARAALLLAAALAGACARREAPRDPAFAQAWQAWHDAREARLRRPDGWLALSGLHWLSEGENRVAGLPGAFVLEGGEVTLRAAPGDGWALEDGGPVPARPLATDRDEEPDRLRHGTRLVQVIDRSGRLALRVWDGASPALRAFVGVEAFPPDPRWRIEARWEPYPTPRKVEVPAFVGPPQAAEAPGRAHFTVDGTAVTLEPTSEGDALFFVFKDRTAPAETYGAGRFLQAEPPEGGKVILDFNRAYNPPCAFTAHATCPLPRPENVLPVRIAAGEKKWGSH